MRKLLLIRHSVPTLEATVPASRWQLSEEGRQLSEKLAACLAAHEPAVIVTSVEPKAVETGQIVAGILGIPWEAAQGLHEHERPVADLVSQEVFRAKVARLLQNPGELIFGAETGDEARSRFALALDAVLEKQQTGNVAVVTHGTVMSLFVSHLTGLDPVAFWHSLNLPAFVVLSLPDRALIKVVADVAHAPVPGTTCLDRETGV